MREQLKDKLESLRVKLLLIMHGLEVVDKQEYSLLEQKSRDVYCFLDYDKFIGYFKKNGIDLDFYSKNMDINIDNVILFTSRTGEVYAVKYLCDRTIDFLKSYDEYNLGNNRKNR